MDAAIERAVEVLRAGGLVAFPTETVYGLGAAARLPAAVRRVFQAKGRPAGHPLIVHLASANWIGGWARDVPADARRLAEALWPGPLTLVLRRRPDVPRVIVGDEATVALRVPDHPVALALLEGLGDGIAAPSANRFGGVSPTTAAHVALDLGDRVDLILDGGPCRVGVESTILDLSTGQPRLLRPGGVPTEAIAELLGATVEVAERGVGLPRAPGTLPSHYAPRADVWVVAADEVEAALGRAAGDGLRAVLLGPPGEHDGPLIDLPREPHDAARRLYAALREVDARGFDVAVVVLPEERGLGRAVADRLRRAAAPRAG
ncbi:MAG: L-threonylcarbamoyladenylate synthase [Sandaracinaceae bacterium]